jgi:hypothetical protein
MKFIKQPDTVALMARYGFTIPNDNPAGATNGAMAAPH